MKEPKHEHQNTNIRGRGASSNPDNRFEKLSFEYDHDVFLPNDDDGESAKPLLRTQLYRDTSKTIVTENNSPDIGFRFSINPYRGCEHGCAYCYARPTHEFLGFSAGLDFESKIFVKENAPELLRAKLMSKSWEPDTISISGITDCYQPIERRFKLTRACLEVLAEFRNPVGLITKNQLITRDIDIFKELAKYKAVMVFISITTLDADLAAALEPRTSRPEGRLQAIEDLANAGIPVGVNVAPVIPGLTDHELPEILRQAKQRGAKLAGFTPLRLPLTVLPIFTEWLEVHRPLKKSKVIEAVKNVRGGKMNDARFGSRMRGEGAIAKNIEQMFRIYTKKYGLNAEEIDLSVEHFQRPKQPGDQLTLF